MARSPHVPENLDPDTAKRIARSFLVVRLIRGGLLLVFLALALVGVEARGWPRAVSVAIVLAMLMLAGSLLASYRRRP